LKKSLESFKVLTECPIIIALLFQLHKKYVAANVPLLVPLIVKAIQLVPMAQEMAHTKAKKEGKMIIGMAGDINNKVAYSELIALQVRDIFQNIG
jgi:transformation/transcription domain-associated protein